MRNHSTRWAIVAFLLTLSGVLVLAACGQIAAPPTRQAVTLPPGETLYLVSGASDGSGGSRPHLLAVQPTSASSAALLTLPAGLASPDHRALYAAAPTASGGTTISQIDPLTGAAARSLPLPGRYTISGKGWGDATLSQDGRWLAVERSNQGGTGTTTVIAVIDTQAMTVEHTFTLDGMFTLDAAASGGRVLYLLQNLTDAAHHYYVRVFDVRAGQLEQGYIVDKSELNETWNMAGYAVARQEASDGSVDYTLYIAPGLNYAFIHALPLTTDATGGFFAHCIDLPVGSSPDLLRYYTLVMSPDGTALYAANTALGVAATISLHGDSSNIYQDAVTATAHFAPAARNVASGTYSPSDQRPLDNGSALSRDGKTLYVSGPTGVRAFDASTLASRSTYLAGQVITSVAVSGDGRTLYGVNPEAGVRVVDLASGKTPRTIPMPMQPWGIVWIRD